MNIAYMITAHSQPSHLQHLVFALNNQSTHFYIHIDKKSDMSAFLQYSFPSDVVFLKNRVVIHHAGISLVNAMLQLLQAAYLNEKCQYFQFLSGWDYPIKNNQFIVGYMEKHYPMNFINFYPLVDDADFVDNIKKYHFIDSIQSTPGFFHKPLNALQRLVDFLPFNRSFFPGMVPYRGSCWFCLNRETVGYILEFLKTEKGKAFLEYFKYVACPDEIFFPTLVLNSPYARSCRYFKRDIAQVRIPMKNENKAYLHHIDWDQTRENPALLDMSDYETLRNSKALYARKFHEEKSASLLAAIDQLIGVYLLS